MTRPYEKLKFYQDICEIRRSVYALTARLGKTHFRLVSQMRDAARSAKQNVREGYARGTIKQFIQSIRISLGSLEELCGDIDDCKEDNLITEDEYSRFLKLYKSAAYLSSQYIKSAYKMETEGSWKIPGWCQTGRKKRNI